MHTSPLFRPTIVTSLTVVWLGVGLLGCSSGSSTAGQDSGSSTCLPNCDATPCNAADDCTADEICGSGGICIPQSTGPGDICENAFEVGALPFQVANSTSAFDGQYGYNIDTCPGVVHSHGWASADVVYAFTPKETGKYDIVLTPSFDATLYVVTQCGDIDSSCIAASDNLGEELTESLNVSLSANLTYYIVVDGWSDYTDVHGSYVLRVDTGCEPDCVGKNCGDNGCGGQCPHQCGTQLCDAETGNCIEAPACPPPCPEGQICYEEVCCFPDCTGKDCGDDGCGGQCQALCVEELCNTNTYKCEVDPNCVPDCTHKDCGYDGCGGLCPDNCVGACTSEEDFIILETIMQPAVECGLTTEGDPAKTTNCLILETGVSESCATCFGYLMSCMVTQCSDVCTGSESPSCVQCLISHDCAAKFHTCAGIEVLFSAPSSPSQ